MSKLFRRLASVFIIANIILFAGYAPTAEAGCQNLSRSTLERKAKPYKRTIRKASQKYGVDQRLIKAVISVESCFKRRARGALGEKGLMQLMPMTARRFKVRSGYNAWQNIHGGTKYLSILKKRYRGNLHRTVAAYNAGEGNVGRTGRIRNIGYVRKVMRAYRTLGGRYGKPIRYAKSKKAYKSKKRVAYSKKRNISRKAKKSRAYKKSLRAKKRIRKQRHTRVARSFRVKRGHTVYEVMRQTGVPVKKIIRLNKLKAPYHIQTGQRLRLR